MDVKAWFATGQKAGKSLAQFRKEMLAGGVERSQRKAGLPEVETSPKAIELELKEAVEQTEEGVLEAVKATSLVEKAVVQWQLPNVDVEKSPPAVTTISKACLGLLVERGSIQRVQEHMCAARGGNSVSLVRTWADVVRGRLPMVP